jgi:polyhydroxyalkanoate synthesis regulator phasin
VEPDLNNVRTDVEILKKDVSNIQGLLGRLDNAIDKIADASNGISRILAVHDTQISDTRLEVSEVNRVRENSTELLHKRISEKEAEHRILAEKNHESLMEFLKDHDTRSENYITAMNERITTLERWKWVMLGGATVVGFLIAELESFLQILR